jgi:succinate dehydrogenase flavin-adding protein (antitoxin of CptAB toxin-antitoxin module)
MLVRQQYESRRGLRNMGTIICQSCESIIEHFESNQVKTLYGMCKGECKHAEATKQK